MLGFCIGETQERLQRFITERSRQAAGVVALLCSCFWPYFTYWGQPYLRRSSWLKVYQEDPQYNYWNPPNTSGYRTGKYAGGSGPSWAISRMFFWCIFMVTFAKVFCDFELNRFVHVHTTQSGMIIFIFHYMVCPSIMDSLIQGGLNDPVAVTYWTILLTFVACFGIYAVIMLIPKVRHGFGIIKADPSSRPNQSVADDNATHEAESGVQLTIPPDDDKNGALDDAKVTL